MNTLRLRLSSLAQTNLFAHILAQAIVHHGLRRVFFTAPLGLGKTTCIRALVANLPGHEEAQVSSPSFSLCNIYPVEPPVVHADLYRLADSITQDGFGVPGELLESLEDPKTVVLLEWAELLPTPLWPDHLIHCTISQDHKQDTNGRLISLAMHGYASQTLEATLAHTFPSV